MTIKAAIRVRAATRVALSRFVTRLATFVSGTALIVACAHPAERGSVRSPEASHAATSVPPPGRHRGEVPALRKAVHDGVAAYRARRYRAALVAFNRVVALRPNDVAARYDRGRTHEALHHWRAAEFDLRFVASRRPTLMNARYALGIARFHLHRYAAAATDFDRVSRARGHGGTAALDAGISYYKLHRWSTAVARFRIAVSERPRSGRARYWLGIAYARTGAKRFAKRELLLASRSRDRAVRVDAHAALRNG